MTGSRLVVLYDADRGLCRWSLNKVLTWDRRGRLRPVAHPKQGHNRDRLGRLLGVDASRELRR